MTKGIKRVQGKRGDAQFQLRMKDDLHMRIKSIAVSRGHSMNTEIVMALDEAFPAPAVPESVNEALLQASQDVADQWAKLLTALGQDPSANPALTALRARITAADAKTEE